MSVSFEAGLALVRYARSAGLGSPALRRARMPGATGRPGVAESHMMEFSYAWNDAALFPGGKDARRH